MPPKGRIPQLDAIRAVAILLVLGRHLVVPPHHAHALLLIPFDLWKCCGWIGVDLFFVLSGYLVSGLLFREFIQNNQVNVKRFLIRRGFKIYPAFIVMILLTALYHWRIHAMSWRGLMFELLFVQNYFGGLCLHTWSLGVEEHFYLIISAIVAILAARRGRNPFRVIPILFAVLAPALLAWRIITSVRQPYSLMTNVFPTHLRFDSLLFGVLLSYIDHFHHMRFREFIGHWKWPILIVSIACIIPTLFVDLSAFIMHTVMFSVLYVAFGGIMMVTLESAHATRSRLIDALAAIGFYSYSIYLWHAQLLGTMERLFARHFSLLVVAYVAISIVVGIFMAKLVEYPMLKLRDRFFPSRAKTPVPPSESARVEVGSAG